MFKDILLTLPAWPNPAAAGTLSKAVAVARFLDAYLNCVVAEPRLPVPVSYHPYSAELEKALNARQREAHEIATGQVAAFAEAVKLAGVAGDAQIVKAPDGGDVSEPIVDHARLRDLTIVPFLEEDGEGSSELVQALVFESGRPVLVLPAGDEGDFKLDRVVVAWDGGRPAARAVGDALPLLQRAGAVRVVTVSKDKQVPESASGAALAAHLARNGVNVTFEEIGKGTQSIGAAIEEAAADADLVVMGAFGHSRLRDFFLGGATRHMLAKLALPTLFSH